MKKIFLMAAVAMMSLAANAQVWVGGEVELSSKHINGAENSSSVVSFVPEIGYKLSDNIDVALGIGFSHSNPASGKNVNTFVFNPYVRYTAVKAGNFSAFIDGGINYGSQHTKGAEKNANTLGISIAPGISYAVSDKVTLVSHLGDGLYYQHSWMTNVVRSNDFGLKLFNGISFGAYVNL